MKPKHNQTDEELLGRIKERLDGPERDHFFDQRLRTLSVDVLAARETRRSRSRVIRAATLALGSVATAITLVIVDPFSDPAPTPTPARTAVVATTEDATIDLAATYVDDIIEEESIEILAEVADPDPLLLTDEDIDQLFEGL